MTSSQVVQVIANIAATVLGSLAAANVYPQLTPVFSAAAGILVGWVNAHKPGAKPKEEVSK